jgi:ABC-type multidrug transport system ATPase subunit
MDISLRDIGKKYNQDWIFRGVNCDFHTGEAYAILGANGSGKSTLLQIISGKVMPSKGSLEYLHNGKNIDVEKIFRYIALSTPYLELIEEYTLEEMFSLHAHLKPMIAGAGLTEFLNTLDFKRVSGKAIRYFSSGMKQRVKLALALLTDTPILLLDEPCANLDQQGMDWYNALMSQYAVNRLVIVCSNHQQEEIAFCQHRLNVNDYK